jgi:hypothetical protein
MARCVLRYRQTNVWTQQDMENWAAFLHTPTGRKLDALVVNYALDVMQDGMAKRGDAFDIGVAEGVRKSWTHLRILSANGAAPETSSE